MSAQYVPLYGYNDHHMTLQSIPRLVTGVTRCLHAGISVLDWRLAVAGGWERLSEQ